MENVLLRFPHLGEAIFQKVDNMSLSSCQTVSASWYRFIQYRKRPKWIRVKHRQVKNLDTLSKELNGLQKYDGSAINGSFVRMIFSVLRNKRMHRTGYSLFHFAALHGYFGICELIIQKMPKIEDKNSSNEWGETPLHFAAAFGHFEVCQLIIQNINEKNPKNCKGFTPLHLAAQNGMRTICELIMKNIVDKNPKTLNGSTPLHEAAKINHLDVCKVLVENGADKNLMDNKGRTPIAYALLNQTNKNSPLFKYLSNF
jgi:hypothetical protein